VYLSHDSYLLQRYVYVDNPDDKYWIAVDKRLKDLKEEEEEDRNG